MTQLYENNVQTSIIIKYSDEDQDEHKSMTGQRKRASSAQKSQKKKVKSDIDIDLISNLAESVLKDRKHTRRTTMDSKYNVPLMLNSSQLGNNELKDQSFNFL